jgi:hypothetical protein
VSENKERQKYSNKMKSNKITSSEEQKEEEDNFTWEYRM